MIARTPALTGLEFDVARVKAATRGYLDDEVVDSSKGWIIDQLFPHRRVIPSPNAIEHGALANRQNPKEEHVRARAREPDVEAGRRCIMFGGPNTPYAPSNLPATIRPDRIAAMTPEETPFSRGRGLSWLQRLREWAARENAGHGDRSECDRGAADIEPCIAVQGIEDGAAGPGAERHAERGDHSHSAEHGAHYTLAEGFARQDRIKRHYTTIGGAEDSREQIELAEPIDHKIARDRKSLHQQSRDQNRLGAEAVGEQTEQQAPAKA